MNWPQHTLCSTIRWFTRIPGKRTPYTKDQWSVLWLLDCLVSSMSHEGLGQYLLSGRPAWWSPFSKSGSRGCAPIIRASYRSTSPINFTPGFWKGDSNWLSNLQFRMSNVDSILVVEQWTSSLSLQECWGAHGSLGHYSISEIPQISVWIACIFFFSVIGHYKLCHSLFSFHLSSAVMDITG